MNSHFLYTPLSEKPFCHAPTLLIRSNGDLVAAWYVYPEKEHIGGSLAIAMKSAGTGAWANSKLVLEDSPYSRGNPVLMELRNGTLWLLFAVLKGGYWDSAEINGAHSSDGGLTWSRSLPIWDQPGIMIRHSPVYCNNGSILLPAYDEKKKISLLLSCDHPQSQWRIAHCFPEPDLIQPVIVRSGPEKLSAFFRPVSAQKRIWRSQSDDDGQTWSNPIQTPLPNPLSGIAAFADKTTVGMVYNHTEEHQRHPLSLAVSNDAGITWGHHWDFEKIRYEMSYPSFSVDSEGTLHGVYTYNRRMIKYVSMPMDELTRMRSVEYGDRISDFKGIHAGKRVFILASGPSLKAIDPAPLRRRITMGLNRSGLFFPETHYQCVMDERLFELYPEILQKTRVLFTLGGRPWGVPLKSLGSEGFSWDLEQGIYTGYTIAYFALQLAVYMGFSEIYFLGLDLKHQGGRTHFFGSDFHSMNHEATEFPKMARMLAYAAERLQGCGIQVYNCSPDSTLKCFPKVSYEYAVSL